MTLRERYHPIAAASNYLVLSGFAILAMVLAFGHGFNLPNLAIGCTIVLVANFCFVASGLLVPNMVAPGKIVSPLNITLPLVFSAWMAVVAFLALRLGGPLEPTLEPLLVFGRQFTTWNLWWFPVGQIIVMSLGLVLAGRRSELSE